MDVLSSRVLLRPVDLAVAREFGPAEQPGMMFFLGSGQLEVSGRRAPGTPSTLVLWMQVRDVRAELEHLSARGAKVLREACQEAWGLVEAWIEDPDGTRIALVQVPADHPLRRDVRGPRK